MEIAKQMTLLERLFMLGFLMEMMGCRPNSFPVLLYYQPMLLCTFLMDTDS